MRHHPLGPTSRSQRRAPLLSLLGFVLLPLAAGAEAPAPEADEAASDLHRFVGDYEIDGYPKTLGFLVRDGRLHLKTGGIEGPGQAVPLVEEQPGRFKLAPDHPNAFGFRLEGGEVRFTLFSMGTPIPGRRLGGGKAGGSEPPQTRPLTAEAGSWTRRDLLAELAAAEREVRHRADDPATRLKYAQLLFQAGAFARAREQVEPLLALPHPSLEALDLAGDVAYLMGEYPQAEAYFKRLVEARSGDPAAQVRAKVDLMFTYYQTNRFAAVRDLAFPAGVQLPTATLMASFEADPYRLEWMGDERRVKVPFLRVDPLPVMTIEVEGVPVQMLLDTGGDMLILDDEIARALGVEPVAKAQGTFGGGRRQEIAFGRVSTVRLGDVRMHGVPITILPTKRFSAIFKGGGITIGGILGTSVLRQFLSTIDYADEALILRERSKASVDAFLETHEGQQIVRVPFVLHATHLMMARGALNDEDGLTFFVDSGLAAEAAFAAPPQTLAFVGIPEPETTVDPDSAGGGGGSFATGTFEIARLGLGELTQTDLTGSFGPLTADSYRAYGFLQDGLISHRFLRRYASWTIDFDSMTYLFVLPFG